MVNSLVARPQIDGRMRILLVEDNVSLVQLLSKGLENAGFEVDSAGSVATATEALADGTYAAIVLDLGLPDGDGSVVLRGLRAKGNSAPVLVLTARGTLQDRVSGLHHGADDYLVKPFAMEELVARLHALLRRPGDFLGRLRCVGNVAFDAVARQVYVDERPQILSARELALLEILIGRAGRVVTKAYAEANLFGQSEEVRSNAVEVYVHRLRKLLADLGANVEIHTVRGVGYLLAEARS